MWEVASNLGEEGRKQMKAHQLKYYIHLESCLYSKPVASQDTTGIGVKICFRLPKEPKYISAV